MNVAVKKKIVEDERVQSVRNQLLQLYPNKKVTSISSHSSLYSNMVKLAKTYGLSVSSFIEHLGFQSQIQVKNMNSIEQCLIELYPNKKVTRLKEIDSNLYDRIRGYAKQEGKKIEKYLKEKGFTYAKSIGRKKIDVEKELWNIYPDGVVVNPYKEYPVLYQKLYRIANRNHMTIQRVLEGMGFEYHHVERDFRSIEECLSELYPNKIVMNLVEMDNKLYKRIHKDCVIKKIKMEQYIESLGYEYVKYSRRENEYGCIV
jgi:hypothetical protein